MALFPIFSRGIYPAFFMTLAGLLAVSALASCASEPKPEPVTVTTDASNIAESASTVGTQPGQRPASVTALSKATSPEPVAVTPVPTSIPAATPTPIVIRPSPTHLSPRVPTAEPTNALNQSEADSPGSPATGPVYTDIRPTSTWGDIYTSFSEEEQSCIRDGLGDERLESIMPRPFGLEGLEEESPALLHCVSDETAREIFLADTAAQMGGLTGEQAGCLRTLLGNFSPSDLAAASTGEPTPENAMMMLSFGLGLVACLPELAAQPTGGAPPDVGGSGPAQLGQGRSPLWSFTTGGWVVTAPAVVNGVVYAGSDDRNLYALEAATGELLWSHTTGDVIRSTPSVVDGRVFFGSNDNHLYALDAATGVELWKFDTGEWVQYSPTVGGGRVYFGAPAHGDRRVHAVDAATGEVAWVAEHPFPMGANHTPAVIGDRVYASGAEYGQFYALNADDGETIWQAEVGGYVESSPTVGDGIVYLTVANRAYAFDESTGDIVWEVNTEEFPARDFPALMVDGIYYLAPSSKVYALDAATGTEVWSYESGMLSTAPVVTGGALYAASGDEGAVFALDAATGQEIWKESTGGQVIQSLTATGGLLYGESDTGELLAADANSGVILWSFAKGGFSDVRGYTVVEEVIYSAGPNNSVYAHSAP